MKAKKYLKKLDKQEKREYKKRQREGDQDEGRVDMVSEKVGEMAVNEVEVEDMMGEEAEETWDAEELDPKQVEAGRKEEVDFMVGKLRMFEFGSYDEAVRRGGKVPTTTKWVEGWKKDDDGKRFVRCRLVGRDFKAKGGQGRG